MRAVSNAVFVCLLAGGCLAQKDSAKLVDPVLHAQGEALQRELKVGAFQLGPYTIDKRRLTRKSETPSEHIELELSLTAPENRRWTARCKAERIRTARVDYGAVLDESQDAITIACEFQNGSGAQWTFEAQGTLAENFGGRLRPKEESIIGGQLDVEILMWRKRLNRVRRHLPQPVAQVRLGEAAIAAMVLSRPEQAWLAADATAEFREVSLATLAAIDLMPLGLEG